jgi:serine/threonine protein kinase
LIGGRYLVEYEVGRGQFGVVYRALDQRLDRYVAVKMVWPEALDSADAVRRFHEEARILCRVHHSNVPAVYDEGEHQGNPYIVFPFIKGRTLKDAIPAIGLSDPVRATLLAARLAEALHEVYSKHNIVHRDVNPANVMQQEGDENSLYLMDFGLAACRQFDLMRATRSGTVMGTPRYMSPEQARGEVAAIGHRSDLYSAAVVLYELLTGRTPFEAPQLHALVLEIILEPPPVPSSLRPGLDPRLDAIVLKGLEKDPAMRYQTGKEFAEALVQWANSPKPRPARGATGGAPRAVSSRASFRLPSLGDESDTCAAVPVPTPPEVARPALPKLTIPAAPPRRPVGRAAPSEKKKNFVKGWWERIGGWLSGSFKPTTELRTASAERQAELPQPISDRVHFSVTSPASMESGQAYALNVWVHSASQRQEVIGRAREAHPLGPVQVHSKGGIRVARGTILTVQLRIPAFNVSTPEDIDVIEWEGEIGNATFSVRVPQGTPWGSYPGLVTIYASGLQIAKVHFDLRVASVTAPTQTLESRAVRHKSAFASYASEDRDAVLGRVQGIQKALPQLDIFLDVAAIRSGEKWAERLEREVTSRDVFYLFWSANASESVWVEREWRLALRARGIDYIDPVPLVDPKHAPPPPELAAALHFNDWVLAFMRGSAGA